MEPIQIILVLSSLTNVIKGQYQPVSGTSQPAPGNASQAVTAASIASSSIAVVGSEDADYYYDPAQGIGSSNVALVSLPSKASESVATAISEGKFEVAVGLVEAADFEQVGSALVSANSLSSAKFILQEVTGDDTIKGSKSVAQIVGGLEAVAESGDCDTVISIYKDIDGLITDPIIYPSNDSMIGQLQEAFSVAKSVQKCVANIPYPAATASILPTISTDASASASASASAAAIAGGFDACVKYDHCFWGCWWSQKESRHCPHESGKYCIQCWVCKWCCFQYPHHCYQECIN